MGLLVDGEWRDSWYDTKATGGRFKRQEQAFRDVISPEPDARFPAVKGRYVLYISHACPWAHRTLLFRHLKGLDQLIDLAVVEPDMLGVGWTFSERRPDPLFGFDCLHQLYTRADPSFTGRVTVPVVWDRETNTIVNNESSEIIRFFDTAFTSIADPSAPLYGRSMYPVDLRDSIDDINDTVYHAVNNGVYKSGFATTQEAYDEAVVALFDALDMLEERLAGQRYLVGDQLTEADWRLFTTLIRFDAVYHVHFKCSRRRIVDYPNLWGFTRELYQMPGVADTVHLEEIARHYYYSHESINPHRIVPLAPALDLLAPHGRGATP